MITSYILDKTIKNICQCEYNFFLNKANVVGVGFGYKVKAGFRTCTKCIAVFVSKKFPKCYLNFSSLIPRTYKGIPTDVVESGFMLNNSLTNKVRPAPGGYSIGSASNIGGGTLGCIVTDGKYYYILTNAHVLNIYYNPNPEEPVSQPAILFGGKIPDDVIATFSKRTPVKLITPTEKPENYVDCSIFKITKRSQISTKIAFLGRIKGVNTNPSLNQSVQKVGATTDLTKGVIRYIGATFLCDPNTDRAACFVNQILTNSMQSPGDSGAILLDDNIHAVGLCQGSNSGRTIDIVNPINAVLNSLNVSIVTG